MHAPARLSSFALLLSLLALAGCGGGGDETECPGDQALVDGRCVPITCEPGEAASCESPRLLVACAEPGVVQQTECPAFTHVCRDARCMRVLECHDADPACCATAADCATMPQPSSCDECRPVARTAWCNVGVCEPLPADDVDYFITADVSELPAGDASRISSLVITIYPGVTADGTTVDCARLLEPVDGTTMHDRKEPMLNPAFSQAVPVSSSGDSLLTPVSGMPAGPGQAVVVTVYDDIGGRGPALGRGCVEYQPSADGVVNVPIEP